MPILPPAGIPAVGAMLPAGFTPTVATPAWSDTGAAERGADFGSKVISALDELQAAHSATDQLAVQAATGDLAAVEDYMVMASQTQLATQLTVAVRNRAVESFNEIMRMQI
ncbi:MAG: flagellar hook-basal body complex protein FliE [Acidimicrobiales bacterium]